jgi:hypothetical protein
MSTPASATGAVPPAKAPIPSDPQEIEREIEIRQARLAATVDELTTRLSPKEVTRRAKETAQARLRSATHAEDGSLRVERIGAVAGAGATVLTWMLWLRRRRKRRQRTAFEVQRVPSRR